MENAERDSRVAPSKVQWVVYLDNNVFGRLAYPRDPVDFALKKIIPPLKALSGAAFLFSDTHIFEINKIGGEDRDVRVKSQLENIAEVTGGVFVDYRGEIDSYTIRLRSPFEVFETINEVPSSIAMDGLLNIVSADQVCVSREMLGLSAKDLNSLSPLEAEELINERLHMMHMKLLDTAGYRQAYVAAVGTDEAFTIDSLILFTQKFGKNNSTPHSRSVMYAALLEHFGYQAQNLKKSRSAAFWDHRHYTIARNMSYFITEDRKLLKKLGGRGTAKTVFGNHVMTIKEFLCYLAEELKIDGIQEEA